MSRRKQHYIWLPGDKRALCGVPANNAIPPDQWFPIPLGGDCEVCIRVVRSHFFRQGREDFMDNCMKGGEK